MNKDKVQSQLSELQKAYHALSRSPNGKRVLEDLYRRFYDVDLTGDDEFSSSVKVGQHSVCLHIRRMISRGEAK